MSKPNVSIGNTGYTVDNRGGLSTTQAKNDLYNKGIKSPSNYLRKNT